MRHLAVLITALALSAGCKDKKPAEPAARSEAGAGSEGAAGAAVAGSAAGSAEAAGGGAGSGAASVRLPPREGKPLAKSGAKLAAAQIDRMLAIEAPTWKQEPRTRADSRVEVRYLTEARPRLAVTLTAAECHSCIPLELEAWKAKADGLKTLLAKELRDHPDTTFEVGATDINGTPAIFTYQVGYADGGSGGPLAYSDAYALYYNDEINMIRVVAEYKDDPQPSREAMVALAPRQDLEKIAKAFLEAYVQTWAP